MSSEEIENYGDLRFGEVYENVRNTLQQARERAYSAVNFYMVEAYWNIGKLIFEE